MQIPSDVRFERCLAVAKHVVGHADSRAEIVVALDTLLRGQDDRRRDRHRRTDLLLGEAAPRMVEAQRTLEREPILGPLLLRIERVVLRAHLAGEHARLQRDAGRNRAGWTRCRTAWRI